MTFFYRSTFDTSTCPNTKVKVIRIWYLSFVRDWFKRLALLSQPVRSQPKTNRYSLIHFSPRFVSARRVCLSFGWLNVSPVFFETDHNDYFGVAFSDRQLKTALILVGY